MALAEIRTSDETRVLIAKFEELHRQGKMFREDKTLYRNQEVDHLLTNLANSASMDVKKYLKVESKTIIKYKILFNLAVLCELCDFDTCTCHYFIVHTGHVHYAGSETFTCI